MPKNNFRIPVGWAGFIKPNIGDSIEVEVGQTMKLFTRPTKHYSTKLENADPQSHAL